jgi:hypothetical protein
VRPASLGESVGREESALHHQPGKKPIAHWSVAETNTMAKISASRPLKLCNVRASSRVDAIRRPTPSHRATAGAHPEASSIRITQPPSQPASTGPSSGASSIADPEEPAPLLIPCGYTPGRDAETARSTPMICPELQPLSIAKMGLHRYGKHSCSGRPCQGLD